MVVLLVAPTSRSLAPVASMISPIRNPPPICTSSPRETMTSFFASAPGLAAVALTEERARVRIVALGAPPGLQSAPRPPPKHTNATPPARLLQDRIQDLNNPIL